MVIDQSINKTTMSGYVQKPLNHAFFWSKNHPGDVAFASGALVMGLALALIFAVGGSAGVAGLFLVLLASVLLCGKAVFPESHEQEVISMP